VDYVRPYNVAADRERDIFMKVIVTGGTGLIGSALTHSLVRRGDSVVALTRNAATARKALGPDVEVLEWNPPQPGPWANAFRGADGVVNLAGEPIEAKRWSRSQKDRMWGSRISSTQAVLDAIAATGIPPRVLVNGSAIGYYGSRGSTVLTEDSPPGSDFLARLVLAWENTARPVESMGVRLALVRTGVVLGRAGGALPLFVLPFRFFAGGTPGRPDAWLSWIHLDDEVGAIIHALDDERVQGPFNATAPNPVTFEILSRQIGEILRRPTWVPMMSTAIKLGLGELGESVMASQRVLPKVLERTGYSFAYTDSAEALRSLLQGSHMAVPNPAGILTTWRSHGMLEALSSIAFTEEE
jgi:uncharacterized protein (TIGR01777 family)